MYRLIQPVIISVFLLTVSTVAACQQEQSFDNMETAPVGPKTPIEKMLASGTVQMKRTKYYDPTYVSLPYPNGDVSMDRGVCTDVVIRALRKADVDLQKEVHEDMKAHFSAYPHLWGLKRTDSSIDHRRVPNLQTYFRRQGKNLPITNTAKDYVPGDIVSWKLSNGLDHIGLVSDRPSTVAGRFLIIHNIGQGTKAEDVLFAWRITGHYRYFKE